VIPRLHLITDDEILTRTPFLERAEEIIRAGGSHLAFHLRGPRTGGGRLFSLGGSLQRWCEEAGTLLLVNDRLDVALALGLRGAHLGGRSLPPREARALLGPRALLGVSVHHADEARAAGAGGASFLVVGTIYPTPSHPGREPGGPSRIREVEAVTGLPLLAIGGVTPLRVPELLTAGAHGVAVRGGVWDAEDPPAAVRGFLQVLGADPPEGLPPAPASDRQREATGNGKDA